MNNKQLLVFYDFSTSICRSTYLISVIDRFNKDLKRPIKRKGQFLNEDSLGRFLVTCFLEYNQKFSMRYHCGFAKVRAQLNEMFEKLADSATRIIHYLQPDV